MYLFKICRIDGFELNPNDKVVNTLLRRLEKTEGECPCHHEEWNENTPAEDKQCPCSTYRNGGGCHCTLYLRSK